MSKLRLQHLSLPKLDELDLAYAVMDGVEARSRVEGRTTQRFKF